MARPGHVLFMLGQLIYHGVVTNRKFKSISNPGLAVVVLGHVPLGIWYLTAGLLEEHCNAWGLGARYRLPWMLFIGVVMRLLGFRILASKDSPYPFAREEIERFDRSGHLARLRNAWSAEMWSLWFFTAT